MGKKIEVNLRVNKNNGQLNISLPKKKMDKDFLKDLDCIKKLKIRIDDWEI